METKTPKQKSVKITLATHRNLKSLQKMFKREHEYTPSLTELMQGCVQNYLDRKKQEAKL